MLDRSVSRYALAAQQFHRARRQAALEALLARLRGNSVELLSFDEVAAALRVRGQSSAGLQQVPIAAIVGSVGRYNDFSRTFLPLLDADQDRWVAVKTAAPHIGDLPPVELYRLGDAYFVLDGNHRISIARQQSLEYIDAYVTEIYTRVALPPGTSPDALIIAAEYAAFLEWSRLDQLRPDVDLRVSVPGQYDHLENHIEAFRFVTEMNEGRDLTLPSAITRWYDEAYGPLAEAIRRQGILRYFPQRTETDFYIWLAAHRIALQTELGIYMAPDVVASRLLARVAPNTAEPRSLSARVRRRLTRLVVPDTAPSGADAVTAQSRLMARYTDQLFKDILVPVDISQTPVSRTAVRQALALAVEEDARLCVVGIATGGSTPATVAAQAQLIEDVEQQTAALQLPADCLPEPHDQAELTGTLAPLYDLLVVDRSFGAPHGDPVPSEALSAVLRDGHRPVWLAAPAEDRPVSSRIVVALDDSPAAREALFIATYLAERWQVDLAILPLASRQIEQELAHARDYLTLHEIRGEVIGRPVAFEAEPIVRRAAERGCDLLILPGLPAENRSGAYERTLMALVQQWPHALLLATWG